MSHAADRVIDLLESNGILSCTDHDEIVALNRKIRAAIEDRSYVELQPAHVWDCEHCGIENFQRSIVVATQEDENGDGGMWVTAPDMVTCKSCGAQFLTRSYDEKEENL